MRAVYRGPRERLGALKPGSLEGSVIKRVNIARFQRVALSECTMDPGLTRI